MRYLITITLISLSLIISAQNFDQLQLGHQAPDFIANTINGKQIKLFSIYKNNPAVLVVLRGWPKYQCPVCSRQMGQFISESEKFDQHKAKIIFIYPGPSTVLQEKAKEFTEDFTFPNNFYFALDPDYSMTNKYGLRWDAPKETAYPSTFVIDQKGKIVYSKISTTHGGRADVEEVITVLEKL